MLVALLAGIAGIVSLTSAKSAALVGVAVSVTTGPAAAQLAVNLVALVVGGSATLAVRRWAGRRG